MRHTKILGLAAVAAAALMAFAASASATVVTTTTDGSAATPAIHAVTEGGHFSIDNPITDIECAATFDWTVESHGPDVTANGNVGELQFSGCTNGWTVEVMNKGSLEIHWTSGHDGTLASSGMTITATIHLGVLGTITCNYATNNTHIGTVTGGNPATVHVEGKFPIHSGSSGLCDSGSAQMAGNYVTTEALYVAKAQPTTLTSPTGTAVEPTVHLVNEGGHISIANSIATIECSSTMEATLESKGSGTAAGAVSALSFTGCTNGWTVIVEAAGELEINATSGYNGTVTSSGATLTAIRHTIFGTAECRYSTSNTHLGTVTGGNPATLKIEGKIPFHGGSGLCGSGSSQMGGNYVTTGALYVDGAEPPPIVLTSPTGTPAAPTVHLVNEGGHITIANQIATIECSSTMEATLESKGSGTAAGAVSALSFTGCTNGWTVIVEAAGELEINATSGYNGTVTSSGATLTAIRHTIFGTAECRYSTSNTHLGTVTGGNPATLKIEGKIPFHGGSGLCGSGSSQMGGNYVTTGALYVDGAEPPPIVLTSPTGTPAAPTVHLVNEGGHITIANQIATIECSSTMEATLESKGSGTAAGAVSALSFTGCTNGWTVIVEAAGELEINATSGYNGTVTSSGATLTAIRHTIFGTAECRYSTSNTHLGTVTGGNPATLKIEGKIPFHGGSGLCGSGSSQMGGNYVTTGALYLDK